MSGQIDVRVSANWDRWVRGFGDLEREVRGPAAAAFEEAGEAFYRASQRHVHVISGELKRSGGHDARFEGPDLVEAIRYDAPYAAYEQARGGPHAFMTRAWEETAARFEAALPEAWKEVVTSWR